MAFTGASRFTGKARLHPDEALLNRAAQIRSGFQPLGWTCDQAVRSLLLLSVPQDDPIFYSRTILRLFSTADMAELVALYAALPLLPFPEHFVAQASEGVRSNMTNVFEAIALHNPFPSDYFDENAWNQLVLKALFTGRNLWLIQGMEKRSNASLSRTLIDYAHERQAAGRTVVPLLWWPLSFHLEASMLPDIEKLFGSGDELAQQAAALVCATSGLPDALALLARHKDLAQSVAAGTLSWQYLAEMSAQQA
jgi:hypothetical protein